jgi:hypothetical protein
MMFGYAFPTEKEKVPATVIETIFDRVRAEPRATEKVCRGTFVSRQQYLLDIRERGYADARLAPRGPMTREEIDHWTAAIGTIR